MAGDLHRQSGGSGMRIVSAGWMVAIQALLFSMQSGFAHTVMGLSELRFPPMWVKGLQSQAMLTCAWAVLAGCEASGADHRRQAHAISGKQRCDRRRATWCTAAVELLGGEKAA